MSKTHTHSQHARIMTERELPTNVYQLMDDVSINGSMVVLRKNRPDIHIAPEPEVIPEKEREQYEEALSEPRTLCFRSACGFMQKVAEAVERFCEDSSALDLLNHERRYRVNQVRVYSVTYDIRILFLPTKDDLFLIYFGANP